MNMFEWRIFAITFSNLIICYLFRENFIIAIVLCLAITFGITKYLVKKLIKPYIEEQQSKQ